MFWIIFLYNILNSLSDCNNNTLKFKVLLCNIKWHKRFDVLLLKDQLIFDEIVKIQSRLLWRITIFHNRFLYFVLKSVFKQGLIFVFHSMDEVHLYSNLLATRIWNRKKKKSKNLDFILLIRASLSFTNHLFTSTDRRNSYSLNLQNLLFLTHGWLILVCLDTIIADVCHHRLGPSLNCQNPSWENLASCVGRARNICWSWSLRSALLFPLVHHYLPWPALVAAECFFSSVNHKRNVTH